MPLPGTVGRGATPLILQGTECAPGTRQGRVRVAAELPPFPLGQFSGWLHPKLTLLDTYNWEQHHPDLTGQRLSCASENTTESSVAASEKIPDSVSSGTQHFLPNPAFYWELRQFCQSESPLPCRSSR